MVTSEILEQRQLLTVTTELMLHEGMGVHTAVIQLPEGTQGFSEFTINPVLGVAQLDELDPSRIFYHEGLAGLDSFEFTYFDGDGETQSYVVNVTILEDLPAVSPPDPE